MYRVAIDVGRTFTDCLVLDQRGQLGQSDPVMARLRAEINKVLAMPDVKTRLNASGGLEPYAISPKEFAERIRSDYDKYGALVRQIGVKID